MKLSTEELNKILIENRILRASLAEIAEWDLPDVRDYHGEDAQHWGSNDARDYFRDRAKETLKLVT